MPDQNQPQAEAKAKKSAPPKVKVRVVKQPVHEDGRTYLKGDVFEVEEERADALGELVILHEA